MPPSKDSPIPNSLDSTGLLPAYKQILTCLSSKPNVPAYQTKAGVYTVALGVLRSMLKSHYGAAKVQSLQRGRVARREVGKRLRERDQAALKVQGLDRVRRAKKEVQERRERKSAATRVQALTRRKSGEKKLEAMKKEREAAVALQSVVRGHNARVVHKQESEKSQAATRIQAGFRMRESTKEAQGRRELRSMNESAIKLQAARRRQVASQDLIDRKAAARKLQRIERGRRGRKSAMTMKAEYKSARSLQARFRGAMGRREARQEQRMTSMAPVTEVCVGDVVKAKLMGEDLWCEGIVIARSGEGGGVKLDEFDIDFGEGEVQEHVPTSSIRKVYSWDTFEIGDCVKAPLAGFGGIKVEAVVKNVERTDYEGMNYYTVEYDDGELSKNVPQSALTKCTSKRMKAVEMWKKGGNALRAISAFSDKKWGAYRRLSAVGLNEGRRSRRNSFE